MEQQILVPDFQSQYDSAVQSQVLPVNSGVAIALVTKSNHPFIFTSGLRSIDFELPVTSKTSFDSGSLTKTITAAAFLKLSLQKQLNLDTPVLKMADILNKAGVKILEEITFRDILSHRTGISALDLLWYFDSIKNRPLNDILFELPLDENSFRKSFIYNNIVFSFLGTQFQKLFGSSWEDAIFDTILSPAGMEDCFPNNSLRADLAIPYNGFQTLKRIDVSSIKAAGGLQLSAESSSKYLQYLLKNTDSFQPLWAPNIAVNTAGLPFFHGLDWLNANVTYGLGWFLSEYRGNKIAFHPGLIDGFTTLSVIIPDKQWGMVTLTNQNFSTFPGQITKHAVDFFLENRAEISSKSEENFDQDLDQYLGTYSNKTFGTISLKHKKGKSILAFQNQEWPIQRIDSGKYLFKPKILGFPSDFVLELSKNDNGKKILLVPFAMDPSKDLIKFEKIPG